VASTNLATFRTLVAETIGLDNSVGGQQTLIDIWVNEGVEQFLLDTHCKVSSTTISLTADTADFTLPSSILAIHDLDVTSSNETFGLTRTTLADIMRMRRASSTSDSPTRYYTVEGRLMVLYPTPVGGSITVYYVPRPAALSATASTPDEIPAEWHGAVAQWAFHRGADFRDDQSSAQGQRYRDEYDRWVQRCRRGERNVGGRTLPVAKVNPRRRSFISNRNDLA
jgi:hypothetical protein